MTSDNPAPTLRDFLLAPPARGIGGGAVTMIDSGVRIGCAVILWCSFLTLFIPTLANAVLRYTTDSSLVWSVEVTQLTFPWFIAAGATLAAQHARHINVALLSSLLPRQLVRALSVLVQLLVVGACAGIIYVYLGFGQFDGGMKFAAGDVAFTSLNIAQSWSYLALLVGYLLLALTALTTCHRLLFDNADAAP